jgi:dimethylaniline monooxygenase (N-oxide forming)
MQAQLWVLSLLKKIPNPLRPVDSYRLHHNRTSRIQYGVDHDAYAYQLALDMGSAPSFLQALARGWSVWVVWAFGGCLNTKFRLVGPWQWGGADEVTRTELLRTVTRRGSVFGQCGGSIPC